MDPPPRPTATPLFQVYLRLRPSTLPDNAVATLSDVIQPERFLTVEPPSRPSSSSSTSINANSDLENHPTHITLHPPRDSRKRAVEKFAFTRVFEEATTQRNVFDGTGVADLVESVLSEGRDALLATLGVTGSGKVSSLGVNTVEIDEDELIPPRVIPFSDPKHNAA